MIVTFVSQCEQKSLNRTRRVLDAFANRIGNRTWQTVITEEGLQAVKKLLRKTATKNTAVSCHWIRSRSRSELVWIVGNRSKFNQQGYVPVNRTHKNILNTQWENDWDYLPLIQSLTALSGLFHDWGKASLCFQKKLKPTKKFISLADPLRHEWVSLLLLNAFVNQQTDEQWLERLAKGLFDEQALIKTVSENACNNPLKKLPPLACLIGWLIVSHHRLPLPKHQGNEEVLLKKQKKITHTSLLGFIDQSFGYANLYNNEQRERLNQCFIFPEGLPCQSRLWIKTTQRWAVKLKNQADKIQPLIENGSWRLIIYYARLSLMLGDHHYSSQDKLENWTGDYLPLANTYFKDVVINHKIIIKKGTPKQKLDQHLIGVTKSAVTIAHLLPAFETELKPAYDIRMLEKKSPPKSPYYWQDKAVIKILAWKKKRTDDKRYGFFTVNMASTGCGKTFANAKIMHALSDDGNSLRYILALGLRTLTLQTGDEYRQRIGLGNDELAVMIGSRAIMELHTQKKTEEKENLSDEESGSESQESLLDDNTIDYQSCIPEDKLSTLLTNDRNKHFLYAPVLACTIDHMMAATETKRGGRYILPSLRLMSSDLVIDEIDDFTGHDLVAIGRLIHLAGMLGRKVMISSATIPPDLAEGYFNAYQEGWRLFAQTRNLSLSIGCAWIDEDSSNSHVNTVVAGKKEDYQRHHQAFVKKRIDYLNQQIAKRKAIIIPCSKENIRNDKQSLQAHYFSCIQQAIIEQHQQHYQLETNTQKQVSLGVVRMANIAPCVALTNYLIQAEWTDNIAIRIMAYHSQQVMLLRSEQEKYLDAVLKRNTKGSGLEDHLIQHHLRQSKAKNMIFIVVATPVEEVGRDHDFDWAVIEPSSFRSIIQLAGRVLRHRDQAPNQPNIAIMQYNLKALQSNAISYTQPGYEESKDDLPSHDLSELLGDSINHPINAIPRIQNNKSLNNHFATLEHQSISQLLTAYDKKRVDSLQGWLTECWWLIALPQKLTPFRSSRKRVLLYLVFKKERWVFVEKDEKGQLMGSIEAVYNIKKSLLSEQYRERLWLVRDYVQLIEKLALSLDLPLIIASSRYGEINCWRADLEDLESEMIYSDQLGMVRE